MKTSHSRSPRWSAFALAAVLAGALSACGADGEASVAKASLVPSNTEAPPSAAIPVEDPLTKELGRIAGMLADSLQGRTVAVFDFPDLRGQVTQLGSYVAEQVTTELVRSGKGQVLERRQVLQVLEELNLRKGDLTDTEVEMAAQQLGAEIIVVGSASVMGQKVEGSARAVRVAGASLLAAERFSVTAGDEVLRLSGLSVPSVGSGGGTGAAAGGGTPEGPILESTVGPVEAVVNECAAAGSVVICSFTFTSATVDAGLEVNGYNYSEARDEGGNVYNFSEFTFGSENGSDWRTVLVAREPTPARLMITGVPNTMTRLTRISIRTDVRIGDRVLNNLTLVFRNVPITR